VEDPENSRSPDLPVKQTMETQGTRDRTLRPLECTWTAHLETEDAREYDAFVLASPAGHSSQTRAWAPVACADTRAVCRFALVRDVGRVIGAALVLRPRIAGIPVPWAWIERGPVVANVEDLGRVTTAIARAARSRGVARLRVMPYWANEDAERAERSLRLLGGQDSQKLDGAHASTLRLDIGGRTDAELIAGKNKEQVRWRAKQAGKAGATTRRGTHEDWQRLRRMHRALMESQGRRGRPDAWWSALERFVVEDPRGAFFVCDYRGSMVSGCVILRHAACATYAWGASVREKLPFSKAIPSLLAAIRWARNAGCLTFDLGGVALEEDRDPKRNAIATFKFDFDKRRVRLVREHALWLIG
jgi:hypothetical protein